MIMTTLCFQCLFTKLFQKCNTISDVGSRSFTSDHPHKVTLSYVASDKLEQINPCEDSAQDMS
jgi:hypothetical protein